MVVYFFFPAWEFFGDLLLLGFCFCCWLGFCWCVVVGFLLMVLCPSVWFCAFLGFTCLRLLGVAGFGDFGFGSFEFGWLLSVTVHGCGAGGLDLLLWIVAFLVVLDTCICAFGFGTWVSCV